MESIDNEVKIESFMKWISLKNVLFSKIEIRSHDKLSRSIYTTSPISKDETILIFPYSELLTSSNACIKSPLALKIKSSAVSLRYPFCTYIASLLLDASNNINDSFRP